MSYHLKHPNDEATQRWIAGLHDRLVTGSSKLT